MDSSTIGLIAIGGFLLTIAWILWSMVGRYMNRSLKELPPLRRTPLPRRASEQPSTVASITQPPVDPVQYDYGLIQGVPEDPANGRGYVIQRLHDKTLLSGTIQHLSQGFESIAIAGARDHLKDLQSPSFRPPALLTLIPEPTNTVDPTVIGVWDAERKHQAGYIPKEETARIGMRIYKGRVVECRSMWEIFTGGQRMSLRILIIYREARIWRP